VLATSYPLLNLFLTILWFFLFVLWIYILIAIFTDLFRSHDLSGGAKALWFVLVLLVPYLGALIYLLARGPKMRDHAAKAVADQEAALRRYVQETAGGQGESAADQLKTLVELRDKGVLTDAEFESEKAKLLA
jgi:hypothetical protein